MGVLNNKINIIFRNYHEIWQQLFRNQDKAVSRLLWCAAQIPLQDWRIYSPQLLGVLLADSHELERSALTKIPSTECSVWKYKGQAPWCNARLWRIFGVSYRVHGGLVATAWQPSFFLCPKSTSCSSLPTPPQVWILRAFPHQRPTCQSQSLLLQ